MALTADVIYDSRGPMDLGKFPTQALEVMYAGAFTALGGQNNGTATNKGRAFAWADDTSNLIPAGFNRIQNTGPATAAETHTSEIDVSPGMRRLPVTGLGGTYADRFAIVYAADDGTFTLTRPTTIGWPIGYVYEFISSSYAWVQTFGLHDQVLMSLFGGARETWFLGVVAGSLASSGDMLTGIPCTRPGKIISVYGIVIEGIVDADADIDINLEINTTNVTGGVIEWVTADAVAAKKTGTAITANNVFHEGDTISVEGTVNTASTAADVGRMGIYAIVEHFIGT